jgi:hypothetical protein
VNAIASDGDVGLFRLGAASIDHADIAKNCVAGGHIFFLPQ